MNKKILLLKWRRDKNQWVSIFSFFLFESEFEIVQWFHYIPSFWQKVFFPKKNEINHIWDKRKDQEKAYLNFQLEKWKFYKDKVHQNFLNRPTNFLLFYVWVTIKSISKSISLGTILQATFSYQEVIWRFY